MSATSVRGIQGPVPTLWGGQAACSRALRHGWRTRGVGLHVWVGAVPRRLIAMIKFVPAQRESCRRLNNTHPSVSLFFGRFCCVASMPSVTLDLACTLRSGVAVS